MIARATRLAGSPGNGMDWNSPPWQAIQPLKLRHFMGKPPEHFPETAVKLAYHEAALYVLFRVEDRYVRAVAPRHQASVCGDSCVEFFFTPGPEVSSGYFNFEMNCGGTLLFHFHPDGGAGFGEIPVQDCENMRKMHSLPRIVDPEIQETVTWTAGVGIPFALLERYCRVAAPKPKAVWRVNFYKCADNSSHPHWLTWSPVDFPKPNFHLPEFFGFLEFG